MSIVEDDLRSAVRVPKTAELVAARIRKAIIRGELKAGDRLPAEAQLIDDFRVSRPTLREAVRILESEGFLEVARGAQGGARIRAPGPDLLAKAAGLMLQFHRATLGDIYTARTILEPIAARLAAQCNPVEAAGALDAHMRAMEATADQSLAHAKALARFHSILLDTCGNVAFGMVGRALQDVIERQTLLAYMAPKPWTEERRQKLLCIGRKSFRRLVGHIAAGRAEVAEAHWRLHLRETEKYWLYKAERELVEVLD